MTKWISWNPLFCINVLFTIRHTSSPSSWNKNIKLKSSSCVGGRRHLCPPSWEKERERDMRLKANGQMLCLSTQLQIFQCPVTTKAGLYLWILMVPADLQKSHLCAPQHPKSGPVSTESTAADGYLEKHRPHYHTSGLSYTL